MNQHPDTALARWAFADRLKSFGYAMAGLGWMLKTQHNAWLHLLATACVVSCGLFLQLRAQDWCLLVVAMALVWMAEAINTAMEYLCDVVSPQYSEAVKRAKDIAAGSVLIAACAAAIIGSLTFWPYINIWLRSVD
jgi:diacylglycerol kinase (ATP)